MRRLRGLDPANVTIHAGKHEIDVRLCKIGLDIDASVAISCFKGAAIDELECVEELYVEEGRWGCAVTQYTFASNVQFSEIVVVDGESVADWNLCGLDRPNRSTSIGVDSAGPGTKPSFIIQKEGLAQMTQVRGCRSLYKGWPVALALPAPPRHALPSALDQKQRQH